MDTPPRLSTRHGGFVEAKSAVLVLVLGLDPEVPPPKLIKLGSEDEKKLKSVMQFLFFVYRYAS